MRKTFLSLVVAAAAFAATPAFADLDPGEKAPNFAGKEFINTSSVDLRTLAGRVVLLEIFRTW